MERQKLDPITGKTMVKNKVQSQSATQIDSQSQSRSHQAIMPADN